MAIPLMALLAGLFPSAELRAEPPVPGRSDGAPGEYLAPPRELGPIPADARQIDEPAFPVAEIDGPFDAAAERVGQPNEFLADDEAKPVEGNTEPADEEAEADDEVDQRLDEIDQRAPVDRQRQTSWKRLAEAVERAEWDRVPALHERLIGKLDKPLGDDSAIRDSKGTLKSVRLEAARLIARLPKGRLELRARELEGDGRSLLKRAIEDGDARLLEQIAAHLCGTEIGFAAAEHLTNVLFDRGHFAMAQLWLDVLLEANAPVMKSQASASKVALIESLTRRSAVPDPSPLAGLAAPLRSSEPIVSEEWLQVGGNSRRHARQSGGEPSLIESWQVTTTDSQPLLEQIDQLSEQLAVSNRPSIPAGAPLFINGKMICRTLRGIEVIDVESGQTIWMAATEGSLDRLVGAGSTTDTTEPLMVNGSFGNPNALAQWQTRAISSSVGALGQSLFNNGATGLLSGDRQRVYFVEDDPVYALGQMSFVGADGRQRTPGRGSAQTNWLRAFDLQTGRSHWRLGGPADGDRSKDIAADLAGWFFMGAPLSDQGELLVVAQRENEIRLFCLDPQTGAPNWSQPISYTESRPDRDLKRRLWSAQLAVAHGVIVCPTLTGWLIGLDRSTGTFLWGYRFAPPQPAMLNVPRGFGFQPRFGARRNPGLMEAASELSASRWLPAAPIIAGNQIYVTPIEGVDPDNSTASVIACLDLFSGQKLWSQDRSDELYVAGVVDDQAIVVSSHSVKCLNKRGRTKWEATLDDEDGAPSGRAVLGEDRLWLPVQKSGLVEIDAKTGTILRRLSLASGDKPLGSLAFYRGQLISYHPTQQRAFDLRDAIEAKLATAKRTGTESAETRLLEAQLAMSTRDTESAINVLRSSLSNGDSGDSDSSDRFFNVMTAAIGVRLDDAPNDCLKLIEQLQKLVRTDEQRREQRRLLADAYERLNRLEDAFRVLVSLVSDAETTVAGSSETTIKQRREARIEVAEPAWRSAHLQSVWGQLTDTARQKFEVDIVALLDQKTVMRASSSQVEASTTGESTVGDSTVRTPAVRTPAVRTPAVRTPAVRTPAVDAATQRDPANGALDPAEKSTRLLRTFAFVPEVRRRLAELAAAAASAGRFSMASVLLQELSQHGTESQRADSLLRCLQLHVDARDKGLPMPLDAIGSLGIRLLRHHRDTVLPDGRAVRAAVADVVSKLDLKVTDFEPMQGSRPPGASLEKLSPFAIATLSPGNRSGAALDASPQAGGWGELQLELTRSSGSNSVATTRSMESPTSRWIAGDLLRIETTNRSSGHSRLSFVRESDDSVYWSVSIPSSGQSGGRRIVRRIGERVFVLNRGMLTSLSLMDRRVLWSRLVDTLDSRDSTTTSKAELFTEGGDWLAEQGLKSSHPWPVSNEHWLAVRGARSITMIDAMTGELRWQFKQPSPGTRVYGTKSAVIFVTSNGGFSRAFSAIDGRPLDAEWAETLVRTGATDSSPDSPVASALKADSARPDSASRQFVDPALVHELLPLVALTRNNVAVLGINSESVVTARLFGDNEPDTANTTRIETESFRGARNETGGIVIEHRRPGLAQPEWSRAYSERAILSRLSNREVAVFYSGAVELLDLETGRTHPLAKIGARERLGRDRWSILRDDERIYLVGGTTRVENHQRQTLRSLHETGAIFAFSARTGEQLWTSELIDESLLLTQFRTNPVLILIRVQNRPLAVPAELIELTILEKATGKVLLTRELPGNGDYQTLQINRPERYIDLLGPNDRLRFSAVTVP